MRRRYVAFTMFASALFLYGCHGTCMHEGTQKDSDVSTCTLNQGKGICKDQLGSTFYSGEDPNKVGLAHCKAMGFETEVADTPEKIAADLKEKDTFTLYAVGTCVETIAASSQEQCIVHWQEQACNQAGHQFFRESAAAGITRCQAAGYGITGSPTDDITKTGSAMFSRKKK